MNGIEQEKMLDELRRTYRSGKTRDVAWRKAQLQGLLKLLAENEDKICEALKQDLGKHPVEAYRDEIGVVKKSATDALRNVEKWMAPQKGRIPLLFFPAKGAVVSEPLGVVLIFASWNFPFSLALDPVIGAMSAGNTVVLKPSELSPKCSSFLANTIPHYLDPEAIKIVEGGKDIAEKLLQLKWDKIFFTGSPQVGRLIMSAAAKHLTPVTLELGGKCPTILDSLTNSSDLQVAVKRIVGGKWGSCSGQVCIAIDYVLVETQFASVLVLTTMSSYLYILFTFFLRSYILFSFEADSVATSFIVWFLVFQIELLKKFIKNFYGENLKSLENLTRIVNKHHFDRVYNLLKDPKVSASIVYGGSVDEENMVIEPTILLNPPLDSEIMTEEIFGPLLPIITLDNIEESIQFINSRPKPLAIYAFTKNDLLKEKILRETSSGSLTFNDALIQFLADTLPFGGVGQSGFGRYHGKYSFDTFSHEKAVMHRSYLIELEPRYPPWNDFKLDFVRLAYKYDYIRLVLLLLGLRRIFRTNRCQ